MGLRPLCIFISFSAEIDFRRQIQTSTDVRITDRQLHFLCQCGSVFIHTCVASFLELNNVFKTVKLIHVMI